MKELNWFDKIGYKYVEFMDNVIFSRGGAFCIGVLAFVTSYIELVNGSESVGMKFVVVGSIMFMWFNRPEPIALPTKGRVK